MLDKLKQWVPKLLKIISIVFWTFFIASAVIWFSQNKDKFFPPATIQEIKNPINPFR